METVNGGAKLKDHISALARREGMSWVAQYPWRLLRWRRGEYLCRYGEAVARLLLLLEGRVSVSITPSHGRTHLITYCAPDSLICGDVEVALGHTQATADLRAEEGDAWCASLPIALYRDTLMDDAGFLRYSVRRLSREMIKDSLYAANNLLFPVEVRMGAYLVNMARDGVFRGNLTRTAELLGVSYRQLSRVMRSFLERGWVEKGDGVWRILNADPFRAMAAQMDEPPK